MIVYHGSPHNFKKLRICKGEHISTEQNEGRGIYFSSIKSVAEKDDQLQGDSRYL